MKLVFPHNEHKDVELLGENFTIGSSPDATIQIDSIGMSAIHATLVKVDDDYSLKIDNPAAMASVNGRLVKESKEVREGDLIILAQVHCKIVSDAKAVPDDNRTRIRMALPKYVLRGVSGVYFGKTFPLRGNTNLGRHSDNDIFVNVDGISRKHALISVLSDGLQVEDLGSSNGTFVNGVQVTEAVSLNVGDEVKLDNIRFLIQSPGMAAPQVTNKASDNEKSTLPLGSYIPATDSGLGSALKWFVSTIVVLAAAGGGAWYMGFLDKFL